MVVDGLRRIHGVPRSGLGRRDRPPPRPRAGRDVEEDPRAPGLRRVLEGPGTRPHPRAAAAQGARDARPQPLGPGGHLRRARGLQGDRAEGREERHGLPRARALASRAGEPGGERAGCGALRLRHGALVPTEHPAAVPRRASQGRRAEGRRGPRHGVRDGHEHLAPPERLARWLRGRLLGQAGAAVPFCGREGRLRTAGGRRRVVRRVRLRSGEARAVPRAAVPGRVLGEQQRVADLAHERPTRGRDAGRTFSSTRPTS